MVGAAILDGWLKTAYYMGRNTGGPDGNELSIDRRGTPDQTSVDRKLLNADVDGDYLDVGETRGMTAKKPKPVQDDIAPEASDVLQRDIAGSHAGTPNG